MKKNVRGFDKWITGLAHAPPRKQLRAERFANPLQKDICFASTPILCQALNVIFNSSTTK
jgi:hypothetical protein